MAIAHNALKKATQAKRRYAVEDYADGFDEIEVSFYDQDGNFGDLTIPRKELVEFVTNNYSSVIDENVGGDHLQYEDNRTASEYLDENLNQVLTDFLNSNCNAN